MLSIEAVESFYQYFYARKYKNLKYRFIRTKTTVGVCEKFLLLVEKKYSLHCVAETFLWDYFLFQFNYWHELTLENQFTDQLIITFIVGKKAFARWVDRDKEFDWQGESYPIIELYGVHKKDLFINHEQPEKVNKVDSSREIRKKYLNTLHSLSMCIEFTTLFDPQDLSCIRCQNRKDCKEILRMNYPLLSKKRGL